MRGAERPTHPSRQIREPTKTPDQLNLTAHEKQSLITVWFFVTRHYYCANRWRAEFLTHQVIPPALGDTPQPQASEAQESQGLVLGHTGVGANPEALPGLETTMHWLGRQVSQSQPALRGPWSVRG